MFRLNGQAYDVENMEHMNSFYSFKSHLIIFRQFHKNLKT
ncbi:hypothetical protein L292_2984 [Acinetobacter junii CIP 107470 = MTCC 11364]|uniref:Uncharacterized protein n=1 Tax=Acinetobacter junii CIP 107470 = MTCC 11364 TaxID=1217666 RepID=S7WS89_ACIJU|nr:hypothetical protein L292_2984 [Acinetobacter junii CIP 107470 = MTCC 11364]